MIGAISLRRLTTAEWLAERLGWNTGPAEPDAARLSVYQQRSVGQIQQVVCEHYGIYIGDLLSQRRAREVSHPRQIAMYLARHHTKATYPGIGAKFGDRDHTTVMHAVKVIQTRRLADPDVEAEIQAIEAKL